MQMFLLAGAIEAQQAQQEIAGAVQDPDERAKEMFDPQRGPRHQQRRALGPLQRDRLGHQFADDDVHAGDQHKGQNAGRGDVRGHARDLAGQPGKQRLDQMRQRRLADPAQAQAGQRDAQLRRRDKAIGIFNGPLHGFGARIAARHSFGNARLAHADQAELRGHKEAVDQHQNDDERRGQANR